jgi:hypothetical protein
MLSEVEARASPRAASVLIRKHLFRTALKVRMFVLGLGATLTLSASGEGTGCTVRLAERVT